MEQDDDDFGFIRNHLTREIAEELGLFRFNARSDGQVKVLETDLNGLHEAVLSPKYNFGAPMVIGPSHPQRRHPRADARQQRRRPRPRPGTQPQGARLRAKGVAPPDRPDDGESGWVHAGADGALGVHWKNWPTAVFRTSPLFRRLRAPGKRRDFCRLRLACPP
jgi:hypothetical protein